MLFTSPKKTQKSKSHKTKNIFYTSYTNDGTEQL